MPFEPQNTDLSRLNFGEPSGRENATSHIEYIYRIANKILTGNPNGMVEDQLVGFSLDQAILTPDVQQKTDAELKALLADSGVWNETTGTNKALMLERLTAPVVS